MSHALKPWTDRTTIKNMQAMTLFRMIEASIIIKLTIPSCIYNQVKLIPKDAKI